MFVPRVGTSPRVNFEWNVGLPAAKRGGAPSLGIEEELHLLGSL